MATVLTGNNIDRMRVYVLYHALGLEVKGMQRRGPSAYSIVKAEFNLKGSKQKVYEQLGTILRK